MCIFTILTIFEEAWEASDWSEVGEWCKRVCFRETRQEKKV